MVQEWNSTGTYTEYSVDLAPYAGQQIYVALRHFNTTGDTYYLYVDDLKLTGIEAEIIRPAKGALVYANGELVANLHHGESQFIHEVNRYDSEYCICVIQEGGKSDGTYFALADPQCATVEVDCPVGKNLSAEYEGHKVVLSWEREIFTDFEDDPQGWTFLDADGDGFVFGIYAAGGMEPNGGVNNTGANASLASFSYINGYGALTPDNYAFMPKVKVLPGATISFYASGYDPSFPEERFGVAVASADGLEINTLDTWTTSYPYARYVVDLAAYAGQEVYVGFRHCSTTAAYALVIDNITVTNVVWAGTVSETIGYNVYRSSDGMSYHLIGSVDGNQLSYEDHDISSVHQYYQVTALNTIPGGGYCESVPFLSVDGLHDYVSVSTDGIQELERGLQVYPNPTEGSVTIQMEGMTRVEVLNALGQVVFDRSLDVDEVLLDFSDLKAGVYILRVTTDGNELGFNKLIIR